MFTSKYLIIRLFVLRCKKEKIYRIAYGAVTEFANSMSEPAVRNFNTLGTYGGYKWDYASIVMAEDALRIQSVYDDLLAGMSLVDSFNKWGVLTKGLNFDVTYNPAGNTSAWQAESLSERQLIYCRVAKIQNLQELFASNKGEIPKDVDKAIYDLTTILTDLTKLPFTKKYSHIGNLELLYTPDRDENGCPLVKSELDKDTFAFIVTIKSGLTDGCDKVTVNVRLKSDGNTFVDLLQDAVPVAGQSCTFDFSNNTPVSVAAVKVWLTKGVETKLVHDVTYHYIRSIVINMSAMGGGIKVNTAWLDKLRNNNLSEKKKKEIDDVSTIEHHETQVSVIGDKRFGNIRKHSLPVLKSNDMFFPKGWDKDTDVVGLVSFLEWFKKKTKSAKSVFLQDPYFEDVALFFLASADIACEYTILTQTGLKTNPDGTDKIVENGERKSIIKKTIERYPSLFANMKLVVKDMPGTGAKLHDRYLIFWYDNECVEAYTLSNSLQGATQKQPLLITQIGDGAFELVSNHIKETLDEYYVETIYDYKQVVNVELGSKSNEIADQGFYDWLITLDDSNVSKFVSKVLPDMLEWNTPAKISSLGYYIARSHKEYELEEEILRQMKSDSRWIAILKDYILEKHYAEYPIGFRNGKQRGFHHYDFSAIILAEFDDIVTSGNCYFLEYANTESSSYGVWGQYLACYFIARLSVEDSIDILKQFKPTLMSIATDKSIEPIYKSANMLMQAIIYNVMVEGNEEYIKALLCDHEGWCRGLGALFLICKSQKEEFNPSVYQNMLSDTKECVALCNAAWSMKPKSSDIMFFYKWLVKSYTVINDKNYLLNTLIDLMKESHYLEDKKEYVSNVINPLINAGVVDKNFISHGLIEGLYGGTMNLESARNGKSNIYFTLQYVLPTALRIVDGDNSLLMDKADKSYNIAVREINANMNKSDDTMFALSLPLIYLRNLLIATLEQYKGITSPFVTRGVSLLKDVDKQLDDIGMEDTKKQFEYSN